MPDLLGSAALPLAAAEVPAWLANSLSFVKVVVGFSIIIFVHELGHFLAAKWCGIRVDRFAIGFGYRLLGWRRGEGVTFGNRPDYRAEELRERNYGETDYCLKALPLGGYVRMLGHDDIIIDEKTGDMRLSDDPRAFTSRPVGQRMLVVSAGVVFNLLFAALLLTFVFLTGLPQNAAVVTVPPDSPAAGKVEDGDRILEIDGQRVSSYRDIALLPIFSEGDLDILLERDGEQIRTTVTPVMRKPVQLPTLLLMPSLTLEAQRNWTPVELYSNEIPEGAPAEPIPGTDRWKLPAIQEGDKVLAVEGQPVKSFVQFLRKLRDSRGRPVRITVERTAPDGTTTQVDAWQRAHLVVAPSASQLERDMQRRNDSVHILGMVGRTRVGEFQDGPAKDAGFEPGDILVEWGGIPYPRYGEAIASIRASDQKPIRVVVERDGQRRDLEVRPRRPFSLFSVADPMILASLIAFGDADTPIVADILPDTPAAELRMPRGSLILSVDGAPVRNWYDVIDRLVAAAGREVQITYRSGQDEGRATLHVPSSLINELDLPRGTSILSVDGKNKYELIDAEGKVRTLDVLSNPAALQYYLKSKIGQTVTISYALESEPGKVHYGEFAVRADNYDPWQHRISYIPELDAIPLKPLETVLSARGNPLTALSMSVEEVGYWIKHVYLSLHMLLIRRTVGVDQVSGPVGIVGAAMEQARISFVDLVYFMAFISVNLAVLNFLPIPVMDGGLMLFLLIEKIKGKPLSLKTQMITTLIGLAAILLLGIIVTIQDIGRLLS